MTTKTERAAQRRKVGDHMRDLHLCAGLGSETGDHCTIAAVNIAVNGILSDRDPFKCMSPVIREWVVRVQDAMPDDVRNSVAWKRASAWIPGTRGTVEDERARLDLILGWMWDRLESVTDSVPKDARGVWVVMCRERTAESARKARAATLTTAAYAYADAAATAATAATAADAYSAVAASAARAATAATAAYEYSAATADHATYWRDANPAKLLTQLCKIGQP